MHTDQSSLVSAQWLLDHHADPDLRIYDCTVLLSPDPNGTGTRAESGRATYEEGHIEGAGFLDLLTDFADPESPFRFTLPTPERFADNIGAAGVSDSSTVILYDRRGMMWAARTWMMLRAFSFRGRAAVLDGGLSAWTAVNGPVSPNPANYPLATCTAVLRPGVFTDKHDVANGGACVVNALSNAQYRGEPGSAHYGRPGRIAGSHNVPWETLVDPSTGCLRSVDEIRNAFDHVNGDQRIITYCGGGIAASLDAFALHLIGRDDVSVYDASLMEWSADPTLPMEVG